MTRRVPHEAIENSFSWSNIVFDGGLSRDYIYLFATDLNLTIL